MKNTDYHIFYTDDDEDDQELFQEVISDLEGNHQVYQQQHGNELLKVLRMPPPKPDIIFLDLNMPHKNGFQVLEEMKKDARLRDIPVVIFSTSNNPEAIEKCKSLGASLYICKPGSYPDMRNMLQEVLLLDWKNFNPSNRKFVFTSN